MVAKSFPSKWMTPCWLLTGIAEGEPLIPPVEKMIFWMLCTALERSGLMMVSLMLVLARTIPDRLSERRVSEKIFVFVEMFMIMW